MGLLGKIGSALGGAGKTIGTIGLDAISGGAFSNAKSVAQTNEMQMGLANQQMGFQERMSDTSYQRGMEDMRKAGLNPMLAMNMGGGVGSSRRHGTAYTGP